MRRQRSIIAFAVAATVFGALYGVYWWIAAGEVRDGIERWAAERRATGWSVGYEDLSVGGFPLRVEAVIRAPAIAAPGDKPAWDWKGPTMSASAPPWNPRAVALEFPGAHRIRVADGDIRRTVMVVASEATAAIRIGPEGRIREITAALGGIVARARQTERPESERPESERPESERKIEIETLKLRFRFAEESPLESAPEPPGPRLSLQASRITLPMPKGFALGPEIARLAIELKLIGVIGPGRPRAALAAWRDAGGIFEAKRLGLKWGALDLEGDGSFALDGKMQPMGAMTARIKGFRETVDALVETGLLPVRNAMPAKLILTFVASATPGGNDLITVPLTLQDRRLSAGPARLMRLPEIIWD